MRLNFCDIKRCHDENFAIKRPKGSGDFLYVYAHTDARIVLDGVDEPFFKNSFVLFEKGYPQNYYALAGGYCNDYIHFSNEPSKGETDNFLTHSPFFLPTNQVIPLSEASSGKHLLQEIYQTSISFSKQKELILDHLLNAFFFRAFCGGVFACNRCAFVFLL